MITVFVEHGTSFSCRSCSIDHERLVLEYMTDVLKDDRLIFHKQNAGLYVGVGHGMNFSSLRQHNHTDAPLFRPQTLIR